MAAQWLYTAALKTIPASRASIAATFEPVAAALFGLAFGLIIERAQVCFTSAFRDLWLTGRTQMAKAIIGAPEVTRFGR